MKVRDSGMPEEKLWNSFFNVELILTQLGVDTSISNLVEIGCGYGTFTIAASKLISGNLYTFDIEETITTLLRSKLEENNISNVIIAHRDILTETTGLKPNSVDYVMLFNILHHEAPQEFLDEAHRILRPNGKVGIIHWRSDIETPRGPDLSIRPKGEDIVELLDSSQFSVTKPPFILKPYHYGLVLSKV